MNQPFAQLNLLAAWLGILLGFGSGVLLGTWFHKEDWLGGYASHIRRLYRLGHISFFGLAMVNLMFYVTARSLAWGSGAAMVASWGFIAGAVSMPVCCLIMAHRPRLRALFLIPVLSLMTGGAVTLWEVAKA